MRQANTFYGRTEAAEATQGKRTDVVGNDRLDSAHLLLLGACSLASGGGSQADELHPQCKVVPPNLSSIPALSLPVG